MKRIVLLVLSCLFFYSLLRDMNLLKALLLCAAIALAFFVSKAPSKYVINAKYPVICLSFALSAGLILYPPLRGQGVIKYAALFLTFFSLTLYVTTLDQKGKGKGLYKEVLALSLLFLSASLNLVLVRSVELFLPLSLTTALFLFILRRNKLLPLAALYMAVMLVLLYLKHMSLYGAAPGLAGIERYFVLATAFLLLLITFVGFVKKADTVWTISLFGLLYVSIDLLVSVGFSMKGLLLHQPFAALLILAPLLGVMLQGEKSR